MAESTVYLISRADKLLAMVKAALKTDSVLHARLLPTAFLREYGEQLNKRGERQRPCDWVEHGH